MKNYLVLAIFIVANISGCKKSEVADTPITPAFQWPAGTSDYAPYTTGSIFVYESTSSTPTVTDSVTYTVTKDTLIDGLTYRKLESNKPTVAATYYANYNAGIVTNINYNFTLQGVTVTKIAQTILKDNVPVTTTWSEVINVIVSGFSIPVTLTYTIMQKDFTKTILAKDYANTIYAKQVISLPSGLPLPAGVSQTTQIDNYFGKGAGLIEKDAPTVSLKLKRYNVVK